MSTLVARVLALAAVHRRRGGATRASTSSICAADTRLDLREAAIVAQFDE